MSIITISTEPQVDPRTHTPTHYGLLAAEINAAFDKIAAVLPKAEEAQALDERQVRKNLNVPDAFCVTATAALVELPDVEGARKFSADRNRNRLQFLEAFRLVDDKLDRLSALVKRALYAEKSALGGDCLQILRVVKAFASDGRSPVAARHVAAMQRDLNRRAQSKAERDAKREAKFNEEVERRLAMRLKEVKAQAA
jgi:hypothetical protein